MSSGFCRAVLVAALHLLCIANVALPAKPTSLKSPRRDIQTGDDSSAAPNPLRVAVFYSPTCQGCRKLEKAMAASEKRWGSRIRVERRHLINKETFADFIAYEDYYGSKDDEAIKGFIGSRYISGLKEIVSRLDGVIAEEIARGSATFVPKKPEKAAAEKTEQGIPSEILERFRKFGTGAVVVAGLLDGINPCAFTTIIFLLSMLAYLGKSKRQLATVGIGFTVAVFVTYFLLGFGLLGAIKIFSVSHGIPTALAYGVAGMTFILAGWSLIDFVRYMRTGDVKAVTLGLPKSVKSRIHKVVRVGLTTRGLIVGSITIGVLVALLESLCTGQVYLPVIVIVSRTPDLRAAAIGYLLLYNLMFIAPLVVVLIIAYCGVKSERLGDFLRRHLAALKLAMAILFAALGALVLATV